MYKYFLIFLFSVFSFGGDYTDSQTGVIWSCPTNQYTAFGYDDGNANMSGASCPTNADSNQVTFQSSYDQGNYCFKMYHTGSSVYLAYCSRADCADGINSDTGECAVPQTCPVGTHNTSQDEEVMVCRCDNGQDRYDVSGTWTGCEEAVCPSTSPQNSYPLVLQNVDSATCSKLYNAVLGFSTEYAQIDGVISCCWSDSVPPHTDPCPPNFMQDENGQCQEIPSLSDSCPTGSYYSIIEKQCKEWFPESNATNDQSGINDGLNSDGTIRDSNSSSYYSGGGSEDLDSNSSIKLEFNEDEVNDMLSDYSDKVKQKIDEFIRDNTSDFFKLYAIEIPTVDGCGCTNPSYNFTISGHTYQGEIDTFCSSATTILETTKPVLWFVFLVTTLLMFFRGN